METKAPSWERRLSIGSFGYWNEVWRIAAGVYEGTWEPPADLAGKKHFDNPVFWPGGLPPWLQNCEKVEDHLFCD